MISGKLKSKNVAKTARLEAKFFLNEDAVNTRVLAGCPFDKIELGELAKVFNPPIFKRQFCSKTPYSVRYCQSSDVPSAALDLTTYILKEQAQKVKALVEKDWILITGFGTIGNVRLVNGLEEDIAFANNVCRVVPSSMEAGYLYAFLASKFGKSQLNQNGSGSVVRYIEAPGVKKTLVPRLPAAQMNQIHADVELVARLREEATRLLAEADEALMEACQLPTLTRLDYEYFGAHVKGRPLSAFTVRNLKPTSLAAFNYSARVTHLRDRVASNVPTRPLSDCLIGRSTFSTGSFKRFELNSPNSIELINQSDIFANRIKGKMLARHYISNQRLVEYGEVIVAGVGTLGEHETFCRALFAGQDLVGKLISGEFIRMKADPEVLPAGYLYAWLASDYGFRLLRATQGGTKLCRPIPRLLADIPVPLLAKAEMDRIAALVEAAQANRYRALQLETQAIHTVETAISAWQK